MNISVAIIEDDPEIRKLLGFLIDGSEGFTCTDLYESVEQGVPQILANPPKILLMDIDLPGINGVEGVHQIRLKNESLIVLMLTVHEDEDTVFKSLCAGANGYLIKGTSPINLLTALSEAQAGGAPMSPSIASKVVKFFHKKETNNLSQRESEVLTLLCKGENYSSLAKKLFISKNTVKAHIKSIYKKLHVHTRAEAVLKAHNMGLNK